MWFYKGRTGIHPAGEYGKQLPIRYFAALNTQHSTLNSQLPFSVELCLDGSTFTATALQTSMRLSARRVSDHMKLLRQVSVLQRRSGRDKRETEYVI